MTLRERTRAAVAPALPNEALSGGQVGAYMAVGGVAGLVGALTAGGPEVVSFAAITVLAIIATGYLAVSRSPIGIVGFGLTAASLGALVGTIRGLEGGASETREDAQGSTGDEFPAAVPSLHAEPRSARGDEPWAN